MISSSELAGLFGQSLDMYLDSCIVVGDDGTILLANQRVRRDFGYKPHELVGKSIETLVPERFIEAHRRGFAASGRSPLYSTWISAEISSDGAKTAPSFH